MKKVHSVVLLWAIGAAAVLTALTLTAATYAWFTVNREVQTDRVTSRTGDDTVELQISNQGGDAFTPMKDATGEFNEAPLKEQEHPLLPVSTADLSSFVYNPFTKDGVAETFLPVVYEENPIYYHDTVYLRAVGESLPEGTRVALYLDRPETPLVQHETGELLTAARLGLTFDQANPVIFRLSDVDEGEGNTSPGGTPLGKGMVLTLQGGTATPVSDPAVSISDRQITEDGGAGPEPLLIMELDRIYAVDVYFYLEGCDPDCLDERVGRDEAVFNLAFYGILTDEEASP